MLNVMLLHNATATELYLCCLIYSISLTGDKKYKLVMNKPNMFELYVLIFYFKPLEVGLSPRRLNLNEHSTSSRL